ncbi:MAG: O-antigen ligase family protein [Planctomycetaceae bacterium]
MSRNPRNVKGSSSANTRMAHPANRVALFPFVVGLLFITRLFVPAESAAQGETLWIACSWLMVAATSCWWWSRDRSKERRQPSTKRPIDLFDVAVLLIVAGPVLSGLMVLLRGGEQRAALNMLWEWVAVGVAYFLLRRLSIDSQQRMWLRNLVVTAGVLLAGLGFWQKLVTQPALAAKFLEAEALRDSPRATTPDEQQQRDTRFRELQLELGPEFLAMEGAGRAALRQRLLFSTEPLGRFALTNTFASLLIVTLLHLVAPFLDGQGKRSLSQRLLALTSIGIVLGCLVLTKSKTAWIGCTLGFCWLMLRSLSSDENVLLSQRVIRSFAITCGVIVVAIGIGFATGALDREVFLESSKSLQYRWQYWVGAMGVLEEHPIMGVGPGNFGIHYLKFKLPEASEAVTDPHNLFLDAWVCGGLIAFLGLLLLFRSFIPALRLLQAIQQQESLGEQSLTLQAADSPQGSDGYRMSAITGVAACLFVWLAQSLLAGRTDPQILALALLWPLTAGIVHYQGATERLLQPTCVAAGLALSVHLLGAGGLAMPAITLLWLWSLSDRHFVQNHVDSVSSIDADDIASPAAATTCSPSNSQRYSSSRFRRIEEWINRPRDLTCAILLGLLTIGSLTTALLPVLVASSRAASAKDALLIDRRPLAAIAHYRAAVDADRLNAEFPRDLGIAQFLAWQTGGIGANQHLVDCWNSLDLAMHRSPKNPMLLHTAADLRMQHWRRSGDIISAEIAVTFSRQATELYPNSSLLRAQFAQGLAATGSLESARSEAQLALQLNAINESAAHTDKLLPEPLLAELRRLAAWSAD